MGRYLWGFVVTAAMCNIALGQTTPGQAATQGRQTGSAAIQPTKQGINTTSGQANVPGYNNNAVEGQYFQGGNGNLGGPSTQRLAECQNSTSADCAAVNFMRNKSSTVNPISINSGDPLVQSNRVRSNDPGSVLGGMMTSFPSRSSSNCAAGAPTPATPQQVIEVCASYVTPEGTTCEKNWVLEIERWWSYRCQTSGTVNLLCNTSTLATCGIDGKNISSYNVARTGAFSRGSMTPTATPGLYNYSMVVDYSCGSEGVGTITFELDTVGQGGYITLNMSNLDDTAAIGVNGYTVYAGHPNSGPSYDGSFFPQTTAAFQVGYSWQEDVGKTVCLEVDYVGNCIRSEYQANIKTFYANTKLLDTCPAGYAVTTMRSLEYCDPYGGCRTADTYTPNSIASFFCNIEGKLLLNRTEGGGTSSASSNATMPLRVGTNVIQAYWGTGGWRRACGNITIQGVIYNVGPVCTTSSQTICEKP
jgi:hypothetical protein